MEKKVERKGLGRGLSALMADVHLVADDLDAKKEPTIMPDATLAIEQIKPNPKQPRIDFDQGALQELADSIRKKGVIQPLVVRAMPDGHYQIVAGERRWRASQLAQLHRVPVVIRDFSDDEVLEIAIIENIQRADLNAVEEALGFRQLMDRFGHTQERLAESLSKSRSHIANTLRLLNLPSPVQGMIRDGKLTAGHARALIGAPDAVQLAEKVVNSSLSVRETEKLVRKAGEKNGKPQRAPRGANSNKDADTRALEADLSANLGMDLSIDHEAGTEGGVIKIRYKDLDQLDQLCQLLSSSLR